MNGYHYSHAYHLHFRIVSRTEQHRSEKVKPRKQQHRSSTLDDKKWSQRERGCPRWNFHGHLRSLIRNEKNKGSPEWLLKVKGYTMAERLRSELDALTDLRLVASSSGLPEAKRYAGMETNAQQRPSIRFEVGG